MEVRMFKGVTLALLTFAGIANADNKIKQRVVNKIQAYASCSTIQKQLEEAIKQRGEKDLNLLEGLNTECREAVDAGNELIKHLGDDYYFFGLGAFIGIDASAPHIYGRMSVGGRFGFGASMVFSANDGKDGISPRQPQFAPMFVFAGNGQYSAVSPRLFEPLRGFLVFVGSSRTKSYADYNGLYVGGGAETPNFAQSEQRNNSTLSATILHNFTSGSTVGVFAKSYNGGQGASGGHIQVLSVNNVIANGRGATITDIYTVAANQTSDLYQDTMAPVVNLFAETTVEAYDATIGRATRYVKSLFNK